MLDSSPSISMSNLVQRPTIAVFDFDGTLTRKDSFLPFVKSACTAQKMRQGLLKKRRAVISYVLGRCSNHFIKETLVTQYFRGWSLPDLQAAAAQFSEVTLPKLLNSQAMERLAWHQAQGHRVVVVSANLEVYLRPWAIRLGINDVIATQLAVEQDKITGKLLGDSCYGKEKVIRLTALLGDLQQYYLYAYGDSKGDSELLAIADQPHYRTFTGSQKIMVR